MIRTFWLFVTALLLLWGGTQVYAMQASPPPPEVMDESKMGLLPRLPSTTFYETAEPGEAAANNAWMMVCSAMVLFMPAPGLALFYGGLVRKKDVLSILMQ